MLRAAYNEDQPRDDHGKFAPGGGSGSGNGGSKAKTGGHETEATRYERDRGQALDALGVDPKANADDFHVDSNEAHAITWVDSTLDDNLNAFTGKSPEAIRKKFESWKKSLGMKNAEETVVREIHLRAATGKVRTALFEGREHLVVPVVACMEGVIHAVNAPEPEFVPSQTLASSVSGWNGRAAVLGHPTKDGRQISANNPAVLEKHRFGTLFQTQMNDTRLCMEAWVDPKRLEALGAQDLLGRIKKGETIEVSIGAHVRTEQRNGEHHGKKYKTAWKELVPDHLAFLPKTRGACSVEMGCGALRAAGEAPEYVTYEVTDGGLLALSGDISLDAKQRMVVDACRAEFKNTEPAQNVMPASYAWPREVYDDHAIIEFNGKLYSVDYEIKDDAVEFTSKPSEVKQAPTRYIAAESGDLLGVTLEEALDVLRTAVGKRHSASDQKMLQTVHDHSVALGADCGLMKGATEWFRSSREISQKERDSMMESDFAGKGTSFPIRKPADVAAAAASIGRAGADNYSTDKLKANIIRIAKRKGPTFVEQLPESWKEVKAAESMQDCPMCDGMGQIDKKDCPECDGTGKVKMMKAASGWLRGVVDRVTNFFKPKEAPVKWLENADALKSFAGEHPDTGVKESALWLKPNVKNLTFTAAEAVDEETALAVKED